ncbi:MAG: hypothetical protein OXG39_16705 [Chloroflexi bacterium]|nr:hypothetical protein [Chloroflexota bacterium]
MAYQTTWRNLPAVAGQATGAVSDNALLACQRVLAPAGMHETFMPSISGVMMQLRSLRRIFEVAVDMIGETLFPE